MMKMLIIIFLGILSLAGFYKLWTWIEVRNFEKEIALTERKESFPIKVTTALDHKKLKKEGYEIHYYTAGEPGKRLLIFLHPAFADHHCFQTQIDFFSKDHRIVMVDLLGHGLSQVKEAKDKIDSSTDHLKRNT